MKQNQFSRSELLFGAPAIQLLSTKKVALFGVGGVGGTCAEALIRGGLGALDIFDDDRVCLTNLNRQTIALHSTIGDYKVDACKARLLDINPYAHIGANRLFYSAETADSIDFSGYDYVIDAIDTVSAKILLVERCYTAGTPIIAAMGAGNKLDPTRFEVADIYVTDTCPLARVMRKELKKRAIPGLQVVYSREQPLPPAEGEELSCKQNCVCPPGTKRKCADRRSVPGSASFVPPAVGLILAGEVLKNLMNF